MNKNLSIYSLMYKDLIDNLCKNTDHQLDLQYFVCYIIFNNGQVFVLSNTYHMLAEYYGESLYKQDYSFRRETICDLDYYLCDGKIKAVSENFQDILENKFNLFRSYYIVRNCSECRFIFGAIKNKKFDNYVQYYKGSIKKFEDFCCDFVDNIVDIIKIHNRNYMHSIILNDRLYRKSVIKNCRLDSHMLSKRERECLYWASQGKTAWETGQITGTSEQTINSQRKRVLEKLNCSNMAHAVFEGIKNGYIGSFNNWWRSIETNSINGITLIDSISN